MGLGDSSEAGSPLGTPVFLVPPLDDTIGLGDSGDAGSPPTLVTPLGSGTAVILGPPSVTLVGLGDSSDAGFPPPGTLVFLVPPPLGDTGGAGGQQ